MKRIIKIEEAYLYIPIYTNQEMHLLSFTVQEDRKKVYELMIPVDMTREEEYNGDYMAEIPVHKYIGKTIVVEGEFPMIMGMRMENSIKRHQFLSHRPKIHFTANRGWTNDPNGMVYQDGFYHLYFQYNPCDVRWENMSWGHAVSKDMLHWAQLDTVMLPDKDGTMFSGCGLINERGLLGLPQDTMLFYYTVAGGSNAWSKGKEFTQKIAYSNDMGETLTKLPEPCIDTIYRDNRDPKVFWHEETQAYIMVLWLKGNDFGIFRSTDLKAWELSQEIYLEDAWECPDLFCLKNPQGESKWFFWCADGYYFPGSFDGYTFTNTGERHKAYISKLPYAAQTYAGVPDRIISIPWLRMKNDGLLYTGAYGIPTEFSYVSKGQLSFLVQKPIREFYEQLQSVREDNMSYQGDEICYQNAERDCALYCLVDLAEEAESAYSWLINASEIQYSKDSGVLFIDGEKYQAGLGYERIEFIIDDRILEIIFDDGAAMGSFVVKDREVSFRMKEDIAKAVEICEIK